jgi:MoaA/NifB/PqqE/SkfB family radical SAM enzyme
VCSCEAWLPISIGKILNFDRLEDIWENPVAQTLQSNIDQGKFDNCAVTRCGVLDHDMIDIEYTISINIDQSCNLRCPSCRSDAVMITSGPEHDEKLKIAEHIVELLGKFYKPCRIVMSGNGDPLASSIMRPLIHNFRPLPNQWIKLFTNGLLLRKQMTNNPIMNHIDEYLMSIDAGSAEVYEKVRLGGKWNVLLDNFDFLKQNIKPGTAVNITMVIQRDNYQDLKNFCQVAVNYGFGASITKLENWGTWSNFDEHDVLNPNHAQHNAAIAVLKSTYAEFHNRVAFGSALQQLLNSQNA